MSLALAPAWSPAPANLPWAASTRWRQGAQWGCGPGCQGPSSPNTLSLQLVSVRGQPRMKLTEDPEKQTLPGSKAAFRLLGSDGEALPPLCGPPQGPRPYIILGAPPPMHRVSPVGRAAVGRGATTPGWPGAEGLASRGTGALYCEAGPRGATTATLGPAGTGDPSLPTPLV